MALSGITTANIVLEMQEKITGARIARIAQTESDELLLTVNAHDASYLLLISANASIPKIHFTDIKRPSPMTAPNFCMLLRKHLANGRIISIRQDGLERIIRIEIEHLDEMGDLSHKFLIVELMGKHSNIIFTDTEGTILDSIKRISSNVSSLREVLPGRVYYLPDELKKTDPLTETKAAFISAVCSDTPSAAAISRHYAGISLPESTEICRRAGIDCDAPCPPSAAPALYAAFAALMIQIKSGDFHPTMYMRNGLPEDFSAIELSCLSGYDAVQYDSISELIERYYHDKEIYSRIRQKSAGLRQTVDTAISRTAKKLDLQEKQLADTEKRDKYRLYGELLRAYAYDIKGEQSSITLKNFYDNDAEIVIPLDNTLSAIDNAKKYFDKYQKLKRTNSALSEQVEASRASYEHLTAIKTSLEIAVNEEDLNDIRRELADYGYVKKVQSKGKTKSAKSSPLHYVSSCGYDIYVGKNNYQNEEVTFRIAGSSDWWFHVKKAPGSHVIVKGQGELPDIVYEEAARLAAHYSSLSGGNKIEVDYTERKNLKKPPSGWPGLVIYHTNYSMITDSDISGIKQIKD